MLDSGLWNHFTFISQNIVTEGTANMMRYAKPSTYTWFVFVIPIVPVPDQVLELKI